MTVPCLEALLSFNVLSAGAKLPLNAALFWPQTPKNSLLKDTGTSAPLSAMKKTEAQCG